jgi:hypothetical protein
MPSVNKAYAVINNLTSGSLGPFVYATYIVVAPDNTEPNPQQTVSFQFNYGDSNEKIHEGLVDAIRTAVGDSSLDVNFIE